MYIEGQKKYEMNKSIACGAQPCTWLSWLQDRSLDAPYFPHAIVQAIDEVPICSSLPVHPFLQRKGQENLGMQSYCS